MKRFRKRSRCTEPNRASFVTLRRPQRAAVGSEGTSKSHVEAETMSRDEILALLQAHKPMLERRFDIVDLAPFGSFARDSATAGSDIDILVRFDGPATSKRYFGAQFYIEDLLGRSVDLVTDRALRRELRPYVEQEAIHV